MKQFTTYIARLISAEQGVVSLGALLLIGAITVEIGLVGMLLVFLLNSTNLGVRLSAEAFAAASSGIDDGLLRIIRNDYTGVSSYQISVGNAGAAITILVNGQKRQITSTGSIFTKKRNLVAVAEVHPVTGRVHIESIKEIPL
jgi:hypothetical protein